MNHNLFMKGVRKMNNELKTNNVVTEANKQLAAKDLGCMKDYAPSSNDFIGLSEEEAKVALKLGIRLDIISKIEDYHGSHEDQYEKRQLTLKEIDDFYNEKNGPYDKAQHGRYRIYRNHAYISTDYMIAKVDTKKLYAAIKRELERTLPSGM